MLTQLPAPFNVIAQALQAWWEEWFNLFLVGLAWALCCLTILLGPPATLGLYYVANRVVHGESPGLGGLLEGGRRYFLRGWLWALLNLMIALILGANLLFYSQFAAPWGGLLQGVFVGLGFVWLVVQFYALPYLMEQEHKSLRLALRNGFLTLLAAPGYTTVLIVLVVPIAALSLLLVLPLLLGTPSLVAVLANCAVIERLATYGLREPD